MNLPFFCQMFQKENLFYVYGSIMLGMMMAVSVCFPGSGLF